MLDFYPRLFPWALITDNMSAETPPGSFYLIADIRVPRSSRPTEFTLTTDRNNPVKIYINDTYMGTVIPSSITQPVFINLFDPPTINFLTATNGVDEPVHLAIAATYMTSLMEMTSRQIYEYAGRQIEKYYSLLSSRWASFIAEYQLPWRKHLPTIRSFRILAVKAMAISLFAEAGTEGGVMEFLSGFASSTPVFKETRNPELWQPDLYQPVTSADDVFGFEGHIWLPNLCVSRWVAFSKLINNVANFYDFATYGEDVITVIPDETNEAAAHEFSTLSDFCSDRALIEYLGCMDNIVVIASLLLTSDIPICAYATTADQIVEWPGIGSSHFFDSGDTLDTEPIPYPPDPPFDSIYDVDLLTDFWVNTPTKKMFDFGKCFDTYPTPGAPIENVNCCMNGPDTVKFTTLACAEAVTSIHTPNNPIFGGDTPGLLENPYFGELA